MNQNQIQKQKKNKNKSKKGKGKNGNKLDTQNQQNVPMLTDGVDGQNPNPNIDEPATAANNNLNNELKPDPGPKKKNQNRNKKNKKLQQTVQQVQLQQQQQGGPLQPVRESPDDNSSNGYVTSATDIASTYATSVVSTNFNNMHQQSQYQQQYYGGGPNTSNNNYSFNDPQQQYQQQFQQYQQYTGPQKKGGWKNQYQNLQKNYPGYNNKGSSENFDNNVNDSDPVIHYKNRDNTVQTINTVTGELQNQANIKGQQDFPNNMNIQQYGFKGGKKDNTVMSMKGDNMIVEKGVTVTDKNNKKKKEGAKGDNNNNMNFDPQSRTITNTNSTTLPVVETLVTVQPSPQKPPKPVQPDLPTPLIELINRCFRFNKRRLLSLNQKLNVSQTSAAALDFLLPYHSLLMEIAKNPIITGNYNIKSSNAGSITFGKSIYDLNCMKTKAVAEENFLLAADLKKEIEFLERERTRIMREELDPLLTVVRKVVVVVESDLTSNDTKVVSPTYVIYWIILYIMVSNPRVQDTESNAVAVTTGNSDSTNSDSILMSQQQHYTAVNNLSKSLSGEDLKTEIIESNIKFQSNRIQELWDSYRRRIDSTVNHENATLDEISYASLLKQTLSHYFENTARHKILQKQNDQNFIDCQSLQKQLRQIEKVLEQLATETINDYRNTDLDDQAVNDSLSMIRQLSIAVENLNSDSLNSVSNSMIMTGADSVSNMMILNKKGELNQISNNIIINDNDTAPAALDSPDDDNQARVATPPPKLSPLDEVSGPSDTVAKVVTSTQGLNLTPSLRISRLKLTFILPSPGNSYEFKPKVSHVGRRDALARIVASCAYSSFGVPNSDVERIVLVFQADAKYCIINVKEMVQRIPIASESELIKYMDKLEKRGTNASSSSSGNAKSGSSGGNNILQAQIAKAIEEKTSKKDGGKATTTAAANATATTAAAATNTSKYLGNRDKVADVSEDTACANSLGQIVEDMLKENETQGSMLSGQHSSSSTSVALFLQEEGHLPLITSSTRPVAGANQTSSQQIFNNHNLSPLEILVRGIVASGSSKQPMPNLNQTNTSSIVAAAENQSLSDLEKVYHTAAERSIPTTIASTNFGLSGSSSSSGTIVHTYVFLGAVRDITPLESRTACNAFFDRNLPVLKLNLGHSGQPVAEFTSKIVDILLADNATRKAISNNNIGPTGINNYTVTNNIANNYNSNHATQRLESLLQNSRVSAGLRGLMTHLGDERVGDREKRERKEKAAAALAAQAGTTTGAVSSSSGKGKAGPPSVPNPSVSGSSTSVWGGGMNWSERLKKTTAVANASTAATNSEEESQPLSLYRPSEIIAVDSSIRYIARCLARVVIQTAKYIPESHNQGQYKNSYHYKKSQDQQPPQPGLHVLLSCLDLRHESSINHIHRACVSHLWRSHGANETNSLSFLVQQGGQLSSDNCSNCFRINGKLVLNLNRQHRAAPTENNVFSLMGKAVVTSTIPGPSIVGGFKKLLENLNIQKHHIEAFEVDKGSVDFELPWGSDGTNNVIGMLQGADYILDVEVGINSGEDLNKSSSESKSIFERIPLMSMRNKTTTSASLASNSAHDDGDDDLYNSSATAQDILASDLANRIISGQLSNFKLKALEQRCRNNLFKKAGSASISSSIAAVSTHGDTSHLLPTSTQLFNDEAVKACYTLGFKGGNYEVNVLQKLLNKAANRRKSKQQLMELSKKKIVIILHTIQSKVKYDVEKIIEPKILPGSDSINSTPKPIFVKASLPLMTHHAALALLNFYHDRGELLDWMGKVGRIMKEG